MDKRSSDYMRSSHEYQCYGDNSYTTVKREFRIDGNDRGNVRNSAATVKRAGMI